MHGSLLHCFDSTNHFHNARHTTWSWRRCQIWRTCTICISRACRTSRPLAVQGTYVGRASHEDNKQEVREWWGYTLRMCMRSTLPTYLKSKRSIWVRMRDIQLNGCHATRLSTAQAVVFACRVVPATPNGQIRCDLSSRSCVVCRTKFVQV